MGFFAPIEGSNDPNGFDSYLYPYFFLEWKNVSFPFIHLKFSCGLSPSFLLWVSKILKEDFQSRLKNWNGELDQDLSLNLFPARSK